MIGWFKLAGMAFLFLSAVYILVSLFSRSMRREKLEKEFDAGDIEGDRDAFIEQGLKDYDDSLRRKLILGVYIIPVVIVAGMVYVINFM